MSRSYAYPYMPEGKTFTYVADDHPYILEAQDFAQKYSLDKKYPTGSVIVRDGIVIGRGANGSVYHETHPCKRVELGIPTGQGYELCEGCHPKNHSEVRAIADARMGPGNAHGGDLYLWGHWWCCEPCWTAMIAAGIKTVYLAEGSYELYNKPRIAAASIQDLLC